MPIESRLEDEMSEAACRLSDRLNRLLDEELSNSKRALSPREEGLASLIMENIMTAEGLVEELRKELRDG